ncbi:glycosyltransferase family 4 protein [Ancylomarina sp.]|uniref:glycosyltransferase family 4 protein n=1 Tax=Ancylomarina sp. TaxID=1970196 RepID=UPI0035614A47
MENHENTSTVFVGPFSPPNNGDGVKNQFLKEGFSTFFSNEIQYFDSINRGENKLKFFRRLLNLLRISDQIILSLNKTGRFVLVPLCVVFSFFIKKKIMLFVMGGCFDVQIGEMPNILSKLFLFFLKKLDFVFVESKSVMNNLIAMGVTNCKIIYNPRKKNGVKWELTAINRNKIVFISRITPTKGVLILIEAYNKLIARGLELNLDFYGPIEPMFEKEFLTKVDSCDSINYMGVIDPSQVQTVFLDYHLFALPTFHPGEGLPGVLVEAGFVGVPVVISDFNSIGEYVVNSESASLVKPKCEDDLVQKLNEIIEDDHYSQSISKGIQYAVEGFHLTKVMGKVKEFSTNGGWNL